MARSLSELIASRKKGEEEEEKKLSSASTTKTSSGIGGLIEKSNLGKSIGLDTFESDLADIGNKISDIYSGWQTPETMANTRVAVEAMQKRVTDFGTYQKKYMPESTLDVDSLVSGYQTVLDDWDNLTQTYGAFKDAESYKNYPNYLKSLEEEQKKKEANKEALTRGSSVYEMLDHEHDFAEMSQYKSTSKRDGLWKTLGMDGSDETYEYINNKDGAREKLIAKYKEGNGATELEQHGYEYMTSEEIARYNYLYAKEGKDSAEKYLKNLEVALSKRLYDESTATWEKWTDDSALASAGLSLISPITSMAGGIGSAIETAKEKITGEKYNPYALGRVAANATSDIREYVGENIAESTEGMEIFGQNIPQFLYQTGMSIADSALGAATLGRAFTPIMGMNAYQQKAKEMTEAGEDESVVQGTALASGIAEALFEYVSIDKLLKIKNVDGIKNAVKSTLAQMGVEGSEEVFTEVANILSDVIIRGDGSDIKSQYNDLIAKGYSPSEANTEVAKQIGSQVGWAFVGGALSGGVMGGVTAGNQYHNLKSIGADIRSNDRVSEMMDVAGDAFMSLSEKDAYNLYTEYANKGVTAENISDAQLGNLYTSVAQNIDEVSHSKKATPQEQNDIKRQKEGLAKVDTAKTEAEKTRVKALNTGEVTEVTATGNSAKIEGIRIEDGKTLLQTNEGEVSAENMTFSQNDAELLAYAEGMGETKGSLLMAQYDGKTDVESYVKSFEMAYAYGETGFGSESVLKNKGVLSELQASAIYASAMTNKAKAQQNAIDAINQKYSENTEYHGNVDDSSINYENLTTTQRDAVNFVKSFAQVTGMNVKLFESEVVNGKRVGKNGSYNRETNTIEIDVHAGIMDAKTLNDTIIPTMSHEMTHWMKSKAPTMYNNMREIVMNTLSADDLTSEQRVAAEMKRMRDAHPDMEVTEDCAIDEIIARGCEDMLSNSKKAREIMSKLSEKEQKSFISKVKSTFKNLMEWVNELFGKYKSKSHEAQILRQYKESLQKLSEAWDMALAEAIQTNKALTEEGITGEQVIGENLLTETTAQLSMRTYENEGRELLHKWLENSDLDAKTKTDIIEQMDHVYNVAAKYAEDNSLGDFGSWSETDIVRGPDGSPLLSVVVPNGDYPLNIDFSQVCKKRKTLNAVLNALVRSGDLDFRSLSQSDINSINRIIKEHGFEIACALCFVDSKRYRVNDWADSFTDTYNKLVKSLTKGTDFVVDEFNYTGRPVKGVEGRLLKDADDSELNFDYINEVLAKNSSGKAVYRYALAIKNNKDLRSILRSSEIISSAGLDAIKVQNRTLYNLVNFHQGSAKPKLAHGEVPYAYDILLQKKFNAEDAYKVGGVRMQSFSDYMANMFFDYVQMIGDLSAKQLPAHAYTKEYYFAKLFGLTGIKINLSVVPKGADITEEQKARFNKMTKAAKEKDPEFKKLKSHAGLDENGNYILEDETFPLEKALEIQNTEGYDKNCGIIWVGVSDKHIAKMLDDPNVPYIIPYHKSSLNPLIARMRNIDFYNDYTKAQNTRYDTKAKKKVPASIWNFDFYGDLAKTNDPRTTADNYIRECRERGYLPKFDDFADHPNYYKLLIDFRVYDNKGNYAPQGAVQMKFPDNFNEIVGESLREAQDTSAKLDASMEGLLSDIRKELKIGQTQFSDRSETEEAKEFSDANIQYSLREEAPPKTTAKAYKVFLLKNGQLYPPMVANPGGECTPVGVWLNADAAPRAEDSKTGRPQVQAGGKGTNTGKTTLAYRPGWHLGDIPQATQFAKKNPETGVKELFPSNFVWAECEYATDVDYQEEAMSYGYNKNGKFQHSLSGLPKIPKDGYYRYRTNPNPDTVPWVITGAMKVNRILTDKETDAICRENGVEPLKRMGGPLTEEKLSEMGLTKLYYTQYSDRYDDAWFDLFDSDGTLAASSAIIDEDVDRLKQRLSMGASSMSDENIKMIAKHLLQKADSRYDFEELTDDLKDIYGYIENHDYFEGNALIAKCNDVAKRILSEQKETKVTNDYAKMVLKDIRSAKIKLNAEQIQNAKNRYGEKYRNALFGRITISNEGVSLDSKWADWSAQYPDIFDANISSADQITELADIYDSLREASEVKQRFDTASDVRALGAEIYNQYWIRSTISAESEKNQQKIKELNLKHRNAMKKLREDYQKRLDEQKNNIAKYKDVIKEIRQKKNEEIKEAKKLGKERMDKYKDRVARNAKIEQITKTALTLNDWLKKNSKDNHIPEVMKAPVAYLLNAIDFSSKQLLGMNASYKFVPTRTDISLSEALEQVHNMVVDANNAQMDEDFIIDFPPTMQDDVRKLSSNVNILMRTVGDNAYVLNQMSLEDLETLEKIVRSIKHSVTQMNQFFSVKHSAGVANLSQSSMVYMNSLGKHIEKTGNMSKLASKMLNWGNATPYYAFKRFGEGGMAVYEALQTGWDTFAFHVKDIIDYAEKTYTDKEVDAWSKAVKTFDVLEPTSDWERKEPNYKPRYQKLQMTDAQIMALYCLQKRDQAKGHLIGGGIRPTDIETGKKTISQPDGAMLSESDITNIISTLSPRQVKVADALQEFMNTICTDWGNEISMERFGYKAFGEPNYFPIQSDKNNLNVDDAIEQNSLYRLLNMSFTKGTIQNANNRVLIGSIFDVFAQHTSDMAKYNALALPVLDAFKWYNYKEKQFKGDTQRKETSLKQSMEKAFGKDALNYFTTFMRDLNGEKNVGRDSLSGFFFTNAKIAAVGANIRVVALQPTAYLRASAVIDPKYMAKAFMHKAKVDKAEKYCGIALWKSLGYYDVNIQRGVADRIKHVETAKDKITDFSMKGAEVADKVTWGYLWNACELEVRDKRKDLKVGSKEFYDEVGRKLREVIYATQVVDSTMTRSHMMRSSAQWDKMMTAFMSEPTVAYNMLQDAYMGWKLTERQTGSKQTAFKKHGKKMARTITAYTVTNMLAALVEAGFDLFRDDEEMTEEAFIEAYLDNFKSDMNLINKIPYAKEVMSLLDGYSSSRTDTQWLQYLVKTWEGIQKHMEGKGNVYTTAKNAMRAISYGTGLPLYNAWRDLAATMDKTGILSFEELDEIFNDTIGGIFPSLKSK